MPRPCSRGALALAFVLALASLWTLPCALAAAAGSVTGISLGITVDESELSTIVFDSVRSRLVMLSLRTTNEMVLRSCSISDNADCFVKVISAPFSNGPSDMLFDELNDQLLIVGQGLSPDARPFLRICSSSSTAINCGSPIDMAVGAPDRVASVPTLLMYSGRLLLVARDESTGNAGDVTFIECSAVDGSSCVFSTVFSDPTTYLESAAVDSAGLLYLTLVAPTQRIALVACSLAAPGPVACGPMLDVSAATRVGDYTGFGGRTVVDAARAQLAIGSVYEAPKRVFLSTCAAVTPADTTISCSARSASGNDPLGLNAGAASLMVALDSSTASAVLVTSQFDTLSSEFGHVLLSRCSLSRLDDACDFLDITRAFPGVPQRANDIALGLHALSSGIFVAALERVLANSAVTLVRLGCGVGSELIIPNSANAACELCTVGTAIDAESRCALCAPGTRAAAAGQTACSPCTGGLSSCPYAGAAWELDPATIGANQSSSVGSVTYLYAGADFGSAGVVARSAVIALIVYAVLAAIAIAVLLVLRLRLEPKHLERLWRQLDIVVVRLDPTGTKGVLRKRRSAVGASMTLLIIGGVGVALVVYAVQATRNNASLTVAQRPGSFADVYTARSFVDLKLRAAFVLRGVPPCALADGQCDAALLSVASPGFDSAVLTVGCVNETYGCTVNWECASGCAPTLSPRIVVSMSGLISLASAQISVGAAPLDAAFTAKGRGGFGDADLHPATGSLFARVRADDTSETLVQATLFQQVLYDRRQNTKVTVGYSVNTPVIASRGAFVPPDSLVATPPALGVPPLIVQFIQAPFHVASEVELKLNGVGALAGIGGLISSVLALGGLILKGIEASATRVASMRQDKGSDDDDFSLPTSASASASE